jgi:CoA:oxalate CoA-transferase
MRSQEMAVEIEHLGHGPVPMTGFPIKLSATPARLRHPAPALGEHTDQVLRGLGYNADRIAILRQQGIV